VSTVNAHRLPTIRTPPYQCGCNPGNQQNRSAIQDHPFNAARPFDRDEQIEHDAQDRAQAENLKRGPAALDDGTGAGPAQDWAARSDANGHEEGDAEKVQQADRRQVLFHLVQRCVRHCERPKFKCW